jgi:transcriptional regulator with XRE-family HTH domain
MALRRGARSAGPENDLDEASDLARVFVNEITWYMSEHKVSRAELATSMGVSAGRVSQILSGEENLTLRTLSGVVRALRAEADFTLRPLDGNAELAGSSR